MKSVLFYTDFLHTIEKLYSRIVLIILQNRMNTYHSEPSIANYTRHTLDIKAPLFKYIDDISSSDKNSVADIQTLDYSFFSQPAHSHTPSQFELSNPCMVKEQDSSEFSSYLKAGHNNLKLNPRIDEKLKHSTWEHIHASIRHARLNDARVAKMHADIANNAFKELAHFVSTEAHAELALEIEDQLDGLLNNK
jgi:hypothetical protein